MNIRLGANIFHDIRHVIFDKDGTVIDSHIYWGEIIRRRATKILSMLSESNIQREDLELAMGFDCISEKLLPNGPIALKNREEVISILTCFLQFRGLGVNCIEIEKIFSQVHAEFIPKSDDFIEAIDGVAQVVQQLKTRNIALSLITSDSEIAAISALKKLNLFEYFDLILGKDSGCGHKKSGLPAVRACKLLNHKKAQTLVIGDAPMDYQMALNAGIPNTILIASGQISLRDLASTGSVVCSTIKDLHFT